MRTVICTAVATMMALPSAIQAADIFVNGTCGSDAWTGVSDVCSAPNGPKASIQAGINTANDGDVVIVTQGEYVENIFFNGKAITVRSSDPTNPGVVMGTIINGGGIGNVVTCDSGEDAGSVLSGFVITGGFAFPPGGGGMFNFGSSPTVTNCTFSGNTTDVVGGGMYNDSSSPTVTNCTFSGNTAAIAGGGMVNANGSPAVTNCTFSGNTAGFDGGGMFNDNSSPSVTNCTFDGNTSLLGGGMENSNVSNPTVTNTGFCNNSPDAIAGSYTDGGGISLFYCPPPIPIPDACPADIDNDGTVGIIDLLTLLAAWGPCL